MRSARRLSTQDVPCFSLSRLTFHARTHTHSYTQACSGNRYENNTAWGVCGEANMWHCTEDLDESTSTRCCGSINYLRGQLQNHEPMQQRTKIPPVDGADTHNPLCERFARGKIPALQYKIAVQEAGNKIHPVPDPQKRPFFHFSICPHESDSESALSSSCNPRASGVKCTWVTSPTIEAPNQI